MKQLLSYDIFDTCLVRTCGEPKHVFDMLATKILGKQADSSKIIDFTLIRMNSELEARKQLINNENEEVTLEDIYSFCDFSKLTSIDNQAIMLAELEIENFVLLPIEKTRTEIEKYVKQGTKVIYISDMYLPKLFIENILKRFGFYVDQNVYVSSDIKKTKAGGGLYDYISHELNIRFHHWKHIGDNIISDHIIPKRKGISTQLIKHTYNEYEKMGNNIMLNGSMPNNGYAFSLSRAIRLSLPDSPHALFASTFIAPMFVSYVYKILCDSKKRGISHLFFIARDGYILYHIAQVFANQFPGIKMSYLYASRQALYMAGLDTLTASSIMYNMPHLKGKSIDGILYELHLSSFDYSKLNVSRKTGEQIIDLLFQDISFVNELNKKHQEQNKLIIKYLEQEGLTNEHCAIVDVVGSRRCQRAINNILKRNNYPTPFSYYFEVTWSRITEYEPYLAMNYQENVITTAFLNRASQPLYEQYFAITNQRRTIEYKDCKDRIEPLFETDYISESYKEKVFEINKSVCVEYARHYWTHYEQDPINIIQASQKIFSYFCYVPQICFLKAIESFRCTGSGEPNETLLNKRSLLYVITHLQEFFRWPEGQLIYSSGWLYTIILFLLRKRYERKLKENS